MPTTDAVLDRLKALHPKSIDLSLGRIERLLGALGRPERRMPGAVHVAGTNGKGSVIALLSAFLEAAGLRVHVYTSPHLIRFNERIRLAGEPIDEAELTALLEECEAANGGAPITFFEITTACAFLAFARAPADIVLLETGLGGRLDATNVLDRPLATVITPISKDHCRFLGETLDEIAFEKAGILKPGVAAVIGPQAPQVERVLAGRAKETGAPLRRFGREWSVTVKRGGIVWRGGARTLELPACALLGAHQVENAGIAIACAQELGGLDVPAAAIAQGLTSVEWPARLQRLRRGPLLSVFEESAAGGWEVWLDGGHNAAAGAALARVARDWADKPLHLVFGMLKSKDPAAFVGPLAPFVREARAVEIIGEEASFSAAEAAGAAAGAGLRVEPAANVAEALAGIAKGAAGPGRVLICGSLYLAGAVLAENG